MGQVPLPDDLAELQAALEAEWPTMQAALRASGVPLNDDDDGDGDGAAGDGAAGDGGDGDDDGDDDGDGEEKTYDAAYVKKLRDEAAKHRRDARDARTKIKEFEDEGKSAAQKLEERASGAETRASKAELELSRMRVALKKGLTEQQAKRLIGDTEEELEADADELLASFKPEEGSTPASRPRERLRPGAVPSAEEEEHDPAKLAAKVPRRYA